ncbi:MAG: hypothetical protein LUG16_01300 [Candidatus Gastranaerophilales bacterium]|nr:hypothetical protein [Candidatus Gastranaerophilales bacterium]
MNQILEKKYSYLSGFFETAIREKRLFHSIILTGSNDIIKYAISMEIARLLNCMQDGSSNCDCQNCKWIRENKHPAVMTISKIDNKNDSGKTVISEEQINSVLDTLINSSGYHRVFIFCDAQIKELTKEEYENYDEFKQTGYNLPQTGDENKLWYPSGLNLNCFSTVAANAMLKSIEEPASNITFIFLASNKDDILQTIVSRSQVFYVPDSKITIYNTDFINNYFADYPDFRPENALDFANKLYFYQTENNLDPKYILDCIQYYITQIIKSNSNNRILLSLAYKDINKIEDCKRRIISYIKEQTVYETLAFYFAKRV